MLFLAKQLDGAQDFVSVYLKVAPIYRSTSTAALAGSADRRRHGDHIGLQAQHEVGMANECLCVEEQ